MKTSGSILHLTVGEPADELFAKAQRVSRLKEKAALVQEGLKALIEREHATSGTPGWSRAAITTCDQASIRTAMIRADCSVWIDHLCAGEPGLVELIAAFAITIAIDYQYLNEPKGLE